MSSGYLKAQARNADLQMSAFASLFQRNAGVNFVSFRSQNDTKLKLNSAAHGGQSIFGPTTCRKYPLKETLHKSQEFMSVVRPKGGVLL